MIRPVSSMPMCAQSSQTSNGTLVTFASNGTPATVASTAQTQRGRVWLDLQSRAHHQGVGGVGPFLDLGHRVLRQPIGAERIDRCRNRPCFIGSPGYDPPFQQEMALWRSALESRMIHGVEIDFKT
jgi:hypothetical protein